MLIVLAAQLWSELKQNYYPTPLNNSYRKDKSTRTTELSCASTEIWRSHFTIWKKNKLKYLRSHVDVHRLYDFAASSGSRLRSPAWLVGNKTRIGHGIKPTCVCPPNFPFYVYIFHFRNSLFLNYIIIKPITFKEKSLSSSKLRLLISNAEKNTGIAGPRRNAQWIEINSTKMVCKSVCIFNEWMNNCFTGMTN